PPLFVILYSIKGIIPGPRWKNITGFKNVSVSMLWAFLMSLFPAVWFDMPLTYINAIFFAFVFFKFIGNMIVFDIRDVKGDSMNGIFTIPAIIGEKRSIILLHILNIISFLILAIPVLAGAMDTSALFVACVSIYSAFYITKIGVWKMHLVADVLSDGEFEVMALFALLSQVINI
ncbi:UbiA family prenyltransferase, partial [Candidatus Micrarchaeota archaeon]|nr:UbiA family prenyltransferase [Candidatus Micrarchaeota archaeon]